MMEACYILSDVIGQEGEFEGNFRKEEADSLPVSASHRPLTWGGKEEVMVWEEEYKTKSAEQEQRAMFSSARISGLRLDTSL